MPLHSTPKPSPYPLRLRPRVSEATELTNQTTVRKKSLSSRAEFPPPSAGRTRARPHSLTLSYRALRADTYTPDSALFPSQRPAPISIDEEDDDHFFPPPPCSKRHTDRSSDWLRIRSDRTFPQLSHNFPTTFPFMKCIFFESRASCNRPQRRVRACRLRRHGGRVGRWRRSLLSQAWLALIRTVTICCWIHGR